MLPNRPRCGHWTWVSLLALAIVPSAGADAPSNAIRDDFEAARPTWHQEETDATIRLITHDRSDRAAHEGRRAERFQFEAGPGSAFYYSYALPRVPLTDDLRASLFVRANRGGVQLFARVVLPGDTHPETKQPSFVLVPGPIYENADRWQRLELIDLRQEAERQARVLRATTRRPVPLDGAYLDRLVINLYGGAGGSEVYLDELQVAPVPPELIAAHNAPPLPAASAPDRPRAQPAAPVPSRSAAIQLVRNRLKRDRFDWVFTAIHAPGADLAKLRRAGCDVLAEDIDADPQRLKDAVEKGFLLMPIVGGKAGPAGLPDPTDVVASAANFPYRESVAFWYLADHLGRSRDAKARDVELERVRKTISGLRKVPGPGSRLTTATVDGDLTNYARPPANLDTIGIRPSPWGSLQQPWDTYQFLNQRRNLGARWNAGGLYWAWIPATPPRVVQTAIWGESAPPAWGYPMVQPEQLRMYTYLALAAGYRGIGYQADADLTRGPGQALLIEMALLNEELDLVESILANGSDPIPFYPTYPPDPPNLPPPGGLGASRRIPRTPEYPPLANTRAAAIGTLDRKGVLLLVTDYEFSSQYQPGQMAEKIMDVTVIAPEGAQAAEITPGGLRWLTGQESRKRVPGGTRLTLRDFAVSSLILVTTDLALTEQIEANLNRVRPKAVALAIEQAELQLAWVTDINGRLVSLGHPLKVRLPALRSPGAAAETPNIDEVAALLKLAGDSIEDAKAARDREDYLKAWTEARRAGRPLRLLMRAHWDQANEALNEFTAPELKVERAARQAGVEEKELKLRRPKIATIAVPNSSPACVSFNTLPQHYQLLDWLQDKAFGANLVPSGSFDDAGEIEEAGWTNHGHQFVGINAKVSADARGPDEKTPALRMKVEPVKGKGIDELPPFLDFPAAAVRSPAVPVGAEYLYRISVLVKRPVGSAPGVGGVILQDSIGGEPLQFRSQDAIAEWTRVVLYRRAPADGEMTVTLGLAGFGEVFFDDFRIERVEEPTRPMSPNIAARTRRRSAPATAARPRVRERTNQ